MSKNISKIMEVNQDGNEEGEESENDEEYICQNQYINPNNILNGINDFETEHNGIKINLEKIDERAPEEEESCMSSIVLYKEKKKYLFKNDKKNTLLIKILKYKNDLYYYFQRWKKILYNNSVKKRIKKVLKRKKKILNNKYKIGDAIIKHEEIKENENKNKTNIISVLNSNEKIKNFLSFFIEFGKNKHNLLKDYLLKWKDFSKTIKKSEKENNIIEIFNNENNCSDTFQRKEIKLNTNKLSKLVNSRQNKEIKKSFRISQINNNSVIKYNELKENNNILNKNKKENNEEEKETNTTAKKKDTKDYNNNTEKKKKGIKSKKIKKVKKKVIKNKNNNLYKLKQIIENLNFQKLKRKYFQIWLKNNEENNKKNDDYIYLSIDQLKEKLSKYSQIQINNENNENNKLISKEFLVYDDMEEKNKLSSQNKNYISIFPNNLSYKDNYHINKNFLIGDNEYDDKDEEEKNISRQMSLNFEENPVEIKQRKYTFEDDPEVNEKTFRIIKLSKPVKEIKGKENGKGNFEVRVAEEFIEYGTEIIRYPSEITETITTTTRIIDDDNENEKKVLNSSEEEIIFQDKKIITKNDNKEDDDNLEKEIAKYGKDKENNNKEYNNNNLINNNEKNYNKKKSKQNIIIKENEIPKEVKKRNNNYINISKEDITDKKDNNNRIDYKMIEKILFGDNNIIINKEDMTQEEEEEKINSFKDFKIDDLQVNNIKDINQLKNIHIKENKKKEKTGDKKIKKLINKYKKALHLLRKVIRSRRKRNKKNFIPEVKLKYYFKIWASNSFIEGIENYRKQKKENKKSQNFEKNLKIKEKITNIIDIIRKHRKKNRKLKIKLGEKDDINKVYFCFNLWRSYIFPEDEDINEKGEEQEEICDEFSNFIENDYINEKNKEIKNINNNLYNTINKRYDNKFNNYKKNTFKIKIPKNNQKISKILKKYILLNEKNLKNFYFKKWNQFSPLEKSYNIFHSKSNSALLNPVKNPFYSKSESNLINQLKRKRNKIEINKDLIENVNILNLNNKEETKNYEKKEIIINTNINEENNKEMNSFKSYEINEEEENEDDEKEQINEEKNSNNLNEINENFYTKISDIENNLKDKKEDNEIYNKNKNNILSHIFEKRNNKNILYFYLLKWNKIISKINDEIKKEEIINNESSKKIMENIKMQFSPFNIINNNNKFGKIFDEKGNILGNSFMNIKRKNKKRIIIRNELSEIRKRANTLLIPKNENMSSNDLNGNDLDEMSEQIKYNANPLHYISFNSNFNKKNSGNKMENEIEKNYNQKREENEGIKENVKLLNESIFNINQTNINLMVKNLYNNDFLNGYLKLLKYNYNIMAAYRIYYLYKIFNEENDYFKLRHSFNKWNKEK